MAVSIDWGTSVISVPKADLTLVQSTPTEIREMDVNWFRLALKSLEDDEAGMPFPITHNHNSEVSLGGLTYARVVEILDPYTITFEDGQYAVNLTGANTNVGDKVNVNQVSVRSNNSAGLISSPEIQFATFGGVVTFDANSLYSGTVFPVGTPLKPVNNLDDAITIATYRGLSEIAIRSEMTVESTHVLDSMTVSSSGNWPAVTLEPGASIVNTVFDKVSLYGQMGGLWNVLIDCWAYDITNFCGWVRGGSIIEVALAPFSVANTGQSYFDDMKPFYPGISSFITMNTDTKISLTGCTDIVTLQGLTAGSAAVCGMLGGDLYVAASCVGGSIEVTGVGVVKSNLGTSTFIRTGLVNPAAVWNDPTGALVQKILRNKQITDPVAGTMTVFDDDGTTVLVQGDLFEDAAAVQPYRGLGAERRERLV